MVGGQRVARVPEQRDLVAWIEHVPGVIVHHHGVAIERQDDPGRPPAGPQVLLKQFVFRRAGAGQHRLGDLVGGSLGQRDQQGVGVLAPASQVHHADGLAGGRMADRHPGAGKGLQVLGVVLMTENMGRLPALQGGADSVGTDKLLGVAEARR